MTLGQYLQSCNLGIDRSVSIVVDDAAVSRTESFWRSRGFELGSPTPGKLWSRSEYGSKT
ncbi:hypothetical protein OP10G_3189 [Fimbriimonas ginsengisoli Gsoil 348]|uniref:Uncharacterized protein n=1 Tax=Fimbriimonas ginsengisoli Gsoil 348 TaxID=661478 RepID=A0A068NTB8_FIMGI|nr:hypothetical protein OP10G_3189 [Fimbriimonas ginsengisoli Gsoil 348]